MIGLYLGERQEFPHGFRCLVEYIGFSMSVIIRKEKTTGANCETFSTRAEGPLKCEEGYWIRAIVSDVDSHSLESVIVVYKRNGTPSVIASAL